MSDAFYWFASEEEFQLAWNGHDARIPAEKPREGWSEEVGAYLARRWRDEDIHLIRTGTIQLFQRRHDTLLEEIVVRFSPNRPLLTVHVYLSHRQLADVRQRYWRLDVRAPQIVAEGNVGQLDSDVGWVAWTPAANPSDVADMVERVAFPWFDLFHEPVELHGLLRMNKVAMVGPDRALELVLAEYGRSQASVFLRHLLETNEAMSQAVRAGILGLIRNPGPLGFGTDPVHNLAIIAHTYGLLKVRAA